MRAPSKSQQQAISHLKGPAMVIAGPGSGKTFTIIQRILSLVRDHHIPPEKILVITYTKAAANEMKERYEKAVTLNSPLSNTYSFNNVPGGSVNFGTFHSVCYNILKQCGLVNANSLIKENEKRKLLRIILCNNGFSEKCSYDIITQLQNSISRMKNLRDGGIKQGEINGKDAEEPIGLSAEFSLQELLLLKKEYDRHLREQRMIDFDDMITECLNLLSANQAVLGRYQNLFQYILADEFQDINPPQYEILKLLALPGNHLFVVGDDDQAIYGFRGATPGIMKQFLIDYKEGEQILLTENYRCGAPIVQMAGQVIARNSERFVKEFSPVKRDGMIRAVCFGTRKEEERELLGLLLSSTEELLIDTAIIVRTNLEVMQYGELLKTSGIMVKGRKTAEDDIFHGFIMDDIAAFLCYLYEGGRRSDFLQFMNKPNRFITRMALPFEIVSQQQMEQYYSQNPQMLLEIRLLFSHLAIARSLQPYLAVSFFRKTFGYDQYLSQKAGDCRAYQRLLKQADKVQCCLKKWKGGSIREFINCQALKSGSASPRTMETKGVSILTMHGAKGLEFCRVFLPDVNEGIIPGRECITLSSIEEERRLLYVAITRAKKELYIYYTKERNRKLSRYLQGIIPPP